MNNITTKNGLLYRNGKEIGLPEADRMAEKHGFIYAEQLVRHLEAEQIAEKNKGQNPKWLNNELQFARLIAEAEAEGVWTTEVIAGLGDQMDLEPDEVCQLLTRAQHVWDEAKEAQLRHQKAK